MLRKFTFSMLLLSLSPLLTFAHEGHGSFHGASLVHYMTSPLHVFPALLAIGMGVWFYLKRKKTKEV